MLTPRPYQREAIDSVFTYWKNESGCPLITAATGTGKSLIMATLIQELVEGWPSMRIMVATHVAELIEQGYMELVGIWPFAPAGIYSAGLGRRDRTSQVLYAGIQTVWNKAAEIGNVDLLIVDEAHLIPAKANTMYGKFISALREQNPDMKILGLTATPFRLDSGRLDEGDDRLFDRVVYDYGIRQGIDDGYLAPLISKGTETGFDLTDVHRLGGDYKQGELQAAVDKSEVYEAAVEEIVRKGSDRRSWLVFGAGVENALHIRDAIRRHGISCETITGDTPKDERRRIIHDFKSYKLRALTNNSVLTTGFDHKGVDLIAAMRPTLSASLYLQMCLDSETEILTEAGWRGVGQVAANDNVAGFDMATERVEWQPALEVIDRALAQGEEMYALSSPHMDIRVTGGHDLVVACRSSRHSRSTVPPWHLERADKAVRRRDNILIPVAGDMDVPDADITDAEIAFLGWFLSDGSLSRSTNAIAISQSVNSPQIAHIEDTLRGCGFRYGVWIHDRKNQYANSARYSIAFGDARKLNGTGLLGWSRLAKWINAEKAITPAYDCLSRRQLLILIDALNRGDGCKSEKIAWERQTYTITFGLHRHTADRIQALCVTRGIRANKANGDPSNCVLHICPTKNRSVVGGAREAGVGRSSLALTVANDNERVWCVTTPMGTIITRRNGKVAVLGNCGRGTRPLYAPGTDMKTLEGRLAGIANGPKPNCLVLDFAGLVRKHGPVDMVEPKKPGLGQGEAPVKQCPECDEIVHASVRRCPCCDYEFPINEEPKITRQADAAPILSTEPPKWHQVTSRTFAYHEKIGGTPSVKVTYGTDAGPQREWVCPQHTGYAKSKADRYWSLHKGNLPFPKTVDEFLDRAGELRITSEVQIKWGGKWPEIIGHHAGEAMGELVPANENGGTSTTGNLSSLRRLAAQRYVMVDDEIPF